MPNVPKSPSQAYPNAGVATLLYTAPVGGAIVSCFKANNRHSTSDDTFKVSIRVGGAADTPAQYLHTNEPLPAQQTFSDVEGWTLNEGDQVWVSSTGGNIAFNLFKLEAS